MQSALLAPGVGMMLLMSPNIALYRVEQEVPGAVFCQAMCRAWST